MTKQIMNPQWDILEKPYEDSSTKSWEYREIRSPDDASIDKVNTIKFYQNDVDNFWLPSKSYLEVRARLLKIDGSVYDEVDKVAFQHGAAIFSLARYFVNDKEIERVDGSHRVSHLNNLLDFSKNYAETSASDQLFFPDTGDGQTKVSYGNIVITTEFNPNRHVKSSGTNTGTQYNPLQMQGTQVGTVALTSTATSGTLPYEDLNTGFAVRRRISKGGSQMITWRIPLRRLFGFCKHVKKVMRGSRHRIQFDRNDIEDIIFRAGDNPGKMEIDRLTWWVPFLNPSLPVLADLEQTLALGGGPLEMPFEFCTLYGPFNKGDSTNLNHTITSLGEKPTKIVVGFMLDSKTSKQKENSYIYHDIKAVRYQAKIGGKFIPEQATELEWSDGTKGTADNYLQAFHNLVRVSDKTEYDDGGHIDIFNWKRLYQFYAIDLRENLHDVVFGQGQLQDLELQFTFNNKPGELIKMFVFVYTERNLLLDIVNKSMLLSVK